MTDTLTSFLLPTLEWRGALVKLETSLEAMRAQHDYPSFIFRTLSEASLLSLFLCTNLKYDTHLTLQIIGDRHLPLLLCQTEHTLSFRAMARFEANASEETYQKSLDKALLMIALRLHNGEQQQSVISLHSADLPDALENYFKQSEQIPTYFLTHWIDNVLYGLFLQQLPHVKETTAPSKKQLLEKFPQVLGSEASPEKIIDALFLEDALEYFPSRLITYQCTCSLEKTLQTLALLEPGEKEAMLLEQGKIEINCEFCGKNYVITE